jgi:serine/threonine protein kinase/WD40 repeat protein
MSESTSESETRLETLFDHAVELSSPEARAAFLQASCGDDARLRLAVEKLVRAHWQAGHFLSGAPPVEEALAPSAGAGEEGPPERIEGYRLLGLIGQGGFSRVYLAEQEVPVRRWVALKIIKTGMDTDEVILRFQRERQVLALMDHPGIAKVLDAGATASGRPYFAMEWVRGVELTRYCDEHRLAVPDRLRLFCHVCLAVMHAHQKGVIHRDLKPSNILVAEQDGQPYPTIIDFGIAKLTQGLASGTTPLTWATSLMGTPAYMSPEQAELGNPDVDTRTDIYSLGAVLYELLTGHPPSWSLPVLDGPRERLGGVALPPDPVRPSFRLSRLPAPELAAIAAARQIAPHLLCRLLRGDLDWIVLKTLEREREQRYRSAADLAEDIEHHLEHRPVSAAAPTLRYRLQKLVRRNRHAVAAAALITGLLLTSVVVSSRWAVRARSSAEQARDSQTSAERAEREARRRLIEIKVAAGLAANERADRDQSVLWFAQAALAADREPEERHVNLLRARNWLTWNALPVGAFQVPSTLRVLQFDPQGRLLMTLSASHECTLWHVGEGTQLLWPRAAGPVEALAWSPDGSLIALALTRGDVEVRRVSDGEVVQRLPQTIPAAALAFSPDGRHLAFGSRRLILWDLRDRQPAGEWPHPEAISQIVFASPSDRMATACLDGLARVFDLAAGTGRFQPVGAPLAHRPSIRVDACENRTSYHEDFLAKAHASELAFLDEGRILVTRSDLYEATLWELPAGRAVRRFEQICCSCNFRLSADGRAMASGMHGSVVGVWSTQPGQSRDVLLPQDGCVFDAAFSPRGDLLLVGGTDHHATFWSLDTGKRMGPRLHHFNDVVSVAFAPDGQVVATAQADGLVRIWTVPRPQVFGPALEYDFGPKRVRLDPQGQRVVAVREPAWNLDFRRTRVYEIASGAPAGPILEGAGDIQDAALSADGRRIAILTLDTQDGLKGALHVHAVATGERLLGSLDFPSPPMSLCFHPTEDRVGLVCRDGQVGVATLGPGLPITWLRPGGSPDARARYQIGFSPDGTRLLALGAGGMVELWHPVADPRSRRQIAAVGGNAWSFSFSASGRYLAITSVAGGVVVWDLEGGKAASPVLAHAGWVYRAAFSADEAWLLTACHDKQARVWDWRTGTLLWQPLNHPDQVLDATFTPKGRWVLTACRDGAVRVWDPQGGDIVMPAIEVGTQALSVVVPPDGRHAVIGSLGGPVHVRSLAGLDQGPAVDPEALRVVGEVLSNGEIRDGKRRELTSAEWLERFRRLQQMSPPWLRSGRPDDPPTGPAVSGDPPPPCGASTNCPGCPEIPAAVNTAVTTP